MRKLHNILYLLLALFIVAACEDDDSFSISSGNQLTFSEDTLHLDTVFSTVPTRTKIFKVYNKSGDGIRCSKIRLDRGNQTGFRVNVDGTYLGKVNGYMTSDVEIRKNDSIMVFVELTSPENGKKEPQHMQDKLIFMLESGVQQEVVLTAHSWDADIKHDLVITGDTLIQSDKPIIIYGGIKVDSGAVMRVNGGTTLYFHPGAGIEVYGRLIAEGSAAMPVVMRGDRLDKMFDYLDYDEVSGQWKGITFRESSYDNIITHADIHSASMGVVCDSSAIDRTTLTMTSSIVHNCSRDNVSLTHSKVKMTNCQITNSGGECLNVIGGDVDVINCTIAQFYPFSADRGNALRYTNMIGETPYPLINLNMVNSLVTGYANDVIMFYQGEDETVAHNYIFDHCVLRTPAIEKDTFNIINNIWADVQDTISYGKKHFILVDGDKQKYDFHLSPTSKAIAGADVSKMPADDLDGIMRKRNDIGCYEADSVSTDTTIVKL